MEFPKRHQDKVVNIPERKGKKQRLERGLNGDRDNSVSPPPPTTTCSGDDGHRTLLGEVRAQVDVLSSTFSWLEADRAAAKHATHVLAQLAKNEEVVNVIVEGDAVPALVKHLQAPRQLIEGEEGSKPYEHEVEKGSAFALGLLAVKVSRRSCCSESQREAALLLGQFAATDSDCKVHIVQRGAVRPLIEMLQSQDVQLREMSAFALGRLAQDLHNQAGIAHNGGLEPLLKLLDSKNGSLQHNAAFALYGLADNEDNVADFIKVGGIQKLQDGEFIVQATKDCVAKTLKRLEENIHGRVLNHLLYLLRVAEKGVQRRVALTLAHLCSPEDQRIIFIDNNGLELLLGLLASTSPKQQLDGSVALYKLANKALTLSPVDAAPPSPTPQVYLGEQYVNNATLSDVTFLVEGRERFHAHRICLLASSDAFRAIFIYTGSVDVTLDIAQDLLRAADQYLLEGLKRLCEYTIAQDISLENVSSMYELSEAFHAMSLRHTCILFMLEQFDKLNARPGYVPYLSRMFSHLIQRLIPEIRNYFVTALTKPNPHDLRL
ncbi:hypothetical protein RJ639_041660 [Escallonia herrerae]|uniref:BTB domain-containing protein n=1 Tax=Escallonia herrerae TaxID=1293975 RepID=A0AA89B7C3_9ASTE|nr:hypothetical protein RJ639_041660 [Escallonia herrerae]